ncbi:uncharacterized protein LOC143957061 isoform X1 [Lithobates pipiens]
MMEPLTFANNGKKILEVTQKIIKLLEGEVPIRCQEVTVSFVIEEGNNLGHKDLYKYVMTDKPPLTSPDSVLSTKTEIPEIRTKMHSDENECTCPVNTSTPDLPGGATQLVTAAWWLTPDTTNPAPLLKRQW